MGASATLIRFARSREAAYLQYGRLTEERAKAIGRIIKRAGFFSQKSEQVQLKAVNAVANDIRLILPNEESRYKKLRDQVLALLPDHFSHASTRTQNHTEPDVRVDYHAKGDQGTQLSFAGW